MTPQAKNLDTTGSASEWETVVEPYGESWDFDKNAVLIGTYRGKKIVQLPDIQNPAKMRDSNVYEIETADTGEKVSVWGNYAIDEAFSKIDPGAVVRIEFQGKIKIKGGAQEVNQFVVQTKK